MSADRLAAEAERIAALLDGRLDDVRRDSLLNELASSPSLASVLADAAAARQDSEADPKARTNTARLPQRRAAWRRSAPIIGVLLAASIVLLILPRSRRRDRPAVSGSASDYAALAVAGMPQLPQSWSAPVWSETRGLGDTIDPRARAVRIGATLTDLEIAMKIGDSASSRARPNCSAPWSVSCPAGGPLSELYVAIARSAAGVQSNNTVLAHRGARAISGATGLDCDRCGRVARGGQNRGGGAESRVLRVSNDGRRGRAHPRYADTIRSRRGVRRAHGDSKPQRRRLALGERGADIVAEITQSVTARGATPVTSCQQRPCM